MKKHRVGWSSEVKGGLNAFTWRDGESGAILSNAGKASYQRGKEKASTLPTAITTGPISPARWQLFTEAFAAASLAQSRAHGELHVGTAAPLLFPCYNWKTCFWSFLWDTSALATEFIQHKGAWKECQTLMRKQRKTFFCKVSLFPRQQRSSAASYGTGRMQPPLKQRKSKCHTERYTRERPRFYKKDFNTIARRE